ncbi:hypothetical protein DSECCO2_447160 [anaerobic digester metagenome]
MIVGAVVGIGLAKGGKNIRYNILGRISIAWVAAPVIAFFISFVALFIFQNVFEQTVQQETAYIFDRVVITKIARDGYDTDALAPVNGRKFDTEQDIFQELKQQDALSREALMGIIAIAEKSPLQVDLAKIKASGFGRNFSPEELDLLGRLQDVKFRHKWQLSEALGQYPQFKIHRVPETEAQKNHNRLVEEKLQILYRSLRIK